MDENGWRIVTVKISVKTRYNVVYPAPWGPVNRCSFFR